MSWRSVRQLKYFLFIVGLILITASAAFYFFSNRPGSCFDGTQNGDELGVDCGGSCVRLCQFEVSDLNVHWARAVPSRGETYDAIAFLENPNVGAGAREVSYIFRLYDAENILTGEREGKIFVNPKERFAIYEDGITVGTGAHAPRRTFFEIKSTPPWEKIEPPRESEFSVHNALFIEGTDGAPRVRATIANNTLLDFRDIDAVAMLFDIEGNLIDAAKTAVSVLKAGEEKQITFLLSAALQKSPDRIEILPRRNMFK